MKPSKKLVFFGNERLVSGLPSTDAPVLRGLIDRGYNIVAVVSNHSDGISRSNRKLEVAEIAEAHGIPLFLPDKPGDIEDALRALQPDGAVLVAYGRIVPQRVIDVFGPTGIINIHPSLLPRHRGPTPIENTIIQGDKEAGVSVMSLTAGMDEGPVYIQKALPLNGSETKFDLYNLLSHTGAELLFEVLPRILDGDLEPTLQSNVGVTYTSLISKNDGVLDPSTDTAHAIERKVRAYIGYPKTRLRIGNTDVIITSVNVVESLEDDLLVIPCANNTFLEIQELIAPSGKTMNGVAFKRGYSA